MNNAAWLGFVIEVTEIAWSKRTPRAASPSSRGVCTPTPPGMEPK
ncbi:MAG: hypothetical protein R3E96_06400 [Planctomycetota bacterium]